MKKYHFFKLLFPLLFLSIIFPSCQKQNNITDIIEPVNLNSGTTDSLTISDMFYAENYENLILNKHDVVETKLNFDKTKLIISVPKDFEGVTFVSFNFNDDWGISSDTHKAVLNSLNQEGVSIRDIKRDADAARISAGDFSQSLVVS